jgi:hypothetical protein
MSDSINEPQVGEDTVHYHMHVHEVHREPLTSEGYEPVVQATTRGPIEMRHYPVAGSIKGAIFVGGAGGGFDTPVRGWLYPRLCSELQSDGITGLRVRYRKPNELEECVLDVLAGISFLEAADVNSVALVGHSFGGAVVIQAAALSPTVRTCVALSTQSYGTAPAADLGPLCSLLLAHGLDDEILPPDCSRAVYEIARQPKQLLLKDRVRHGLDEWADELPDLIGSWVLAELGKPHPQSTRAASGNDNAGDSTK